MATRHARSIPAVLLIVAGALTVISVLVSGIPHSGDLYLFTYLLSYLAIAIGFLLLAGTFTHRLGRTALYLAAAGWAVYGLSAAFNIVPILSPVAGIVAIVFGLIAGFVVFRRRFFTPRASTMFLTMTIIGAVYLLFPFSLLAISFGASLVVTGVFIQRRS